MQTSTEMIAHKHRSASPELKELENNGSEPLDMTACKFTENGEEKVRFSTKYAVFKESVISVLKRYVFQLPFQALT